MDIHGNATQHSHPVGRQEFYRQEYRRSKLEWQDSLSLYRELIDQNTQKDTRILDIGCGHGDFVKSVYIKTPHTYGIDPDEQALSKNAIIRNKVVGTTDYLPFSNNFFDLVVSAWVLEHLDHPETAFREIYRVLKPGGLVFGVQPVKPLTNAYFDLVIRANENVYGYFWVEEMKRWFADQGIKIQVVTPLALYKGTKSAARS